MTTLILGCEEHDLKEANVRVDINACRLGSDKSEVTVPTKLEDTQNRIKGKCEKLLKLEKLLPLNTSNTIFLNLKL